MSKFVRGNDEQDNETWQAEHANDPVVRAEPVDNRSLFEKLQEQKAAKEDALNEATKFSNLIRRLDNDEIDFLVSVREQKKQEEAKRMKERNAAIGAFKQAQRKLDSLQTDLSAMSEADVAARQGPEKRQDTVKRKNLAVTGVVKRARKNMQDSPLVQESASTTPSADIAHNPDVQSKTTYEAPAKKTLISYASDSDS